jgi:chemotaxis protein MotB
MRRSPWLLAAVTATLLACHPTKEEYAAKVLEAEAYKKNLTDESAKAADLGKKLDETSAKLAALEAERKTLTERVTANEASLGAKQTDLRNAQAKLAEQQALIDELSKHKKKLEQAKEELEKKSSEYERLASSLKSEIDTGKIELSELRGKMTVKMKDKILFASGSATLGKEGKEALDKVAQAFKGLQGKVVRVEGHTDNVPTGGGAFPTNWDLSTARALAVVRFLQERGVDPTILAAAGYGEHQPVAPNDTPEGRSLNRRIEIVLAAADGAPKPAAAKSGKN